MRKYPEPIIVYGPERSGTSLITGIIHLSGAWIGPYLKHEKLNAKGFFENLELRKSFCLINHETSLEEIREIIFSFIESQGYQGGPWVVKQKDSTHWLWKKGFLDAKWVMVWRDINDIVDSRRRSYQIKALEGKQQKPFNEEALIKKINSKYKYMMDMYNSGQYRICNIRPHRVVKRGIDIDVMLNWLGLPYDQEKIQAFIDPDLWHFGS